MSSISIGGPRAIASLHLSGVAGGIALLWWRFNGVPSDGPASSDLLNYVLPVAALAVERIASGELPLWNVDTCPITLSSLNTPKSVVPAASS